MKEIILLKLYMKRLMKFCNITIFFLFSCLFSLSQNIEYIYDVEIKGISIFTGTVGKCNFKIKNNSDNFEMSIITKTTKLANLIYPYKDKIKMKIDTNYSLLSIEQNISNNNKKLKIVVDKINRKILRNGKELSFYSDTLFSPYSLIHYLKNKEIELNQVHSYNIFDNRKIENITFEITKIEKIKVPYGTYECLYVKPNHGKNLIKNSGSIELWYTNNSEKIPLKINLETKIGTFILKLNKIIVS